MKKIINAALIAVVLSGTVASIIDARTVGATTTPRSVQTDAKKLERTSIDLKGSEAKKVKQVEKAVGDIKRLEEKLAALRNWTGDVITGYSLTEQQRAKEEASPLIMEMILLEDKIKEYDMQIGKIATEKAYGFGSPVVAEKDQEEYATLKKERAAAKDRLNDLNPAFQSLSVIAGKRYCDAVRVAIIAITAAVAGIKIDQLLFQGSISDMAKNRIAGLYKQVAMYAKNTNVPGWSWIKGKVSSSMNAIYGAGATVASATAGYGSTVADIGRIAARKAGLGAYVGQTSAEMADDRMAADRMAADRMATDRMAADRMATFERAADLAR